MTDLFSDLATLPEPLVTIATFYHQTEFLLARTRLESAGIECFSRDENLLRIHSHAFGGIQLQVFASDVHDAQKILQDTASINE
jgi:hypothetical protein